MQSKGHKIPLCLTALLLSAISMLAGCSQSPEPADAQQANPATPVQQPYGPPDKVEVVYFYKSIPPPCECLAHAGENVNTTVTNEFKSEIESGKLAFHYLASDEAKNAGMVKKYDPAPFSLIINSINGQSEQIYNVGEIWEFLYDEPNFRLTVKRHVENALKGQK